VSPDT
ncbi:hypothetical protein D043_3552B, partial [Vibrio parahaemolyticus EKP-021]